MKKSFFLLLLGFILVLSGCTANSVFVSDTAFNGTPIASTPTIIITQQDREASAPYTLYALSSSEESAMEDAFKEVSDFLSFSSDTPEDLVDDFVGMITYGADSDSLEMLTSIAKTMTPIVEIDAKLMAEANINYELDYDIDFSQTKKVPSTETYYVPGVFYLSVYSAEVIDVEDYLDSYIDLSEEDMTPEEISALETSLIKGLKFYKNLVGKKLVLSNGYSRVIKENDEFKVIMGDTLDGDMHAEIPLNLDTASDWAKTYIEELYFFDIISGDQFTNYNSPITREEFCKLLVKTDEYKTSSKTTIAEDPFYDTDDKYVLKAYAMGIINGISADTFNPTGLLTREQCAAIISNYLKISSVSIIEKYNDDHTISTWARDAVYKLKNAKVMSGSNNTFNPKGNLTIEQAITLTSRLLTMPITDTITQTPLETTVEAPLKTPKLNEITSWGYQIQGLSEDGAVDKLVESDYDMLVLEPTRTDTGESEFDTKGMVDAIKATTGSKADKRKLVIAYIDIGQAEDWRWYWNWSIGWDEEKPDDWPEFIITKDADGWEGNYTVKYWDDDWKAITIYGVDSSTEDYNSILDEVLLDGFDGIYLDWVEAFEDLDIMDVAEAEGVDPQEEMIQFIKEMGDYARKKNPDFVIIQQNASLLSEGNSTAFEVVDGIAQEGIWYTNLADKDWDDPLGYDQATEEQYTEEYLVQLEKYLHAGIPVFNVEYTVEHVDEVIRKSLELGFIPYCSRSSLEQLTD